MDICTKLNNLSLFNNSALTIGTFDGMHRGHIKIIKELKRISYAKNIPAVAITFDPHPKSILKNNARCNWEVLMDTDEKLKIFEKNGIDYTWVIPFSDDFAKITAKKFLEKYLIKYFNPIDIILGYDHHFGYKREGDINFLNSVKEYYNFDVHEINSIKLNNITVSSTKIRNYINDADIESANNLIGAYYSFSGKVIKGSGKGHEINFPTANIKPYNLHQLIPARGVYCVDVSVDMCNYTGMCNIGIRPTFYEKGENVIEVHLITNEELSLYGKEILLKFKKYIREEKKYNSAAELATQLHHDRYNCLSI